MWNSIPHACIGIAALVGLASAESRAESSFQTFSLPQYPRHAIRIKQQNDTVCDARSKQYTGWLDSGGKHLFFWYFESLSNPDIDPLMVWLNGGPGASSMTGLFMELGPCLVKKDGTGTYHNPSSWTTNASMIFIDQPAPVGFSWADDDIDDDDLPGDSFAAAEDTVAFMEIFYDAFPHLRKLDFHIAGESYGGHYLPAWAATIVRHNANLDPTSARRPIPLKSVLIGNGYVDAQASTWGFYDTLCTTKPGLAEAVFNASRCDRIGRAMPRCEGLAPACDLFPDPIVCHAIDNYCEEEIMGDYAADVMAGKRNFYDITAGCDGAGSLCYAIIDSFVKYLNLDSVWEALEPPRDRLGNYSFIDVGVGRRFTVGIDGLRKMTPEVRFVLESGIDVLIYNGNYDLVCNTWGNLRWTAAMPWSGQMEYATKPLVPWYAEVDGETVVAGTMKEVRAGKDVFVAGKDPLSVGFRRKKDVKAGRFSFVSIDAAGHMVPMDKPEASLQMLQTWLAGGDFAVDAMKAEDEHFGSQQVDMGEL